MPTFHNPTADATEASEALRGLAHATRVFEDPADTYAVLGDLLAGVRSLRQVLDQLATAHVTHRVRAHDDAGDQAAGATNALTTKMRLRDALRHILLGGLIAAGMGSLSMAVITAWLGLPPEAIPAGGAAGSAAYLVGVFGPAFIEMLLARLRRANEGGGDE